MTKDVTHRIEGNAAAGEELVSETSPTTGSPSPPETPPAGSVPEVEPSGVPGSEPQATPAHEYQNPMLRGRSPEEIERIFGMYEQTSREQGARLTASERRLSEVEGRPAAPAPEPKVEATEFFADPMTHVKRALEETVAPLREEIREAKSYVTGQDARAGLRNQYADFAQVEPYIDYMLAQTPYPDPNDPGLLNTLYFTAKGMMASQGISVESPTPTPTAPGAPQPAAPTVPPQHRASTPPPPPPSPAAPGSEALRPLTETEKRLAREQGLSHAEYLRWQAMDIADVATADFDKPKEGN